MSEEYAPNIDLSGAVIGAEPEEEEEYEAGEKIASMPFPSAKGIKPVGIDANGVVTFSDQSKHYPDGHIEMDMGSLGKWIKPSATAKMRQAPKAPKTPEEVMADSVARKGILRSDYPGGTEGDKQFKDAGRNVLSTERKSLTEMQIKGAAYYERANDAAQRAEKLLAQYDPQSFTIDKDLLVRDLPLARRLVSDTGKSLFPVVEEFTNAVLRRDSGAAVTNVEMKRALERYFPVPGDTPEAVAEKARNREVTMDSLKTGIPEGTIRKPEAAAQIAQPAAPKAQNQLQFKAGQIYRDAQGRKAKYREDGTWEPVNE